MNGPLKRGKPRPEFAGLALPKFAKAKRSKPTKAKTPEAATQALVEAYCTLVNLACFHIPEIVLATCFRPRGAVGGELGVLRDAAAMVGGFPDCAIFCPKHPGYVLTLEVKTEIGKMSKAQVRWKHVLGTKVPRSFEEARAEIDAWRKMLDGLPK